jgi:hypothetical protein
LAGSCCGDVARACRRAALWRSVGQQASGSGFAGALGTSTHRHRKSWVGMHVARKNIVNSGSEHMRHEETSQTVGRNACGAKQHRKSWVGMHVAHKRIVNSGSCTAVASVAVRLGFPSVQAGCFSAHPLHSRPPCWLALRRPAREGAKRGANRRRLLLPPESCGSPTPHKATLAQGTSGCVLPTPPVLSRAGQYMMFSMHATPARKQFFGRRRAQGENCPRQSVFAACSALSSIRSAAMRPRSAIIPLRHGRTFPTIVNRGSARKLIVNSGSERIGHARISEVSRRNA